MFGLGKRHEDSSPKDEPAYEAQGSKVDEMLAEMNRLQAAEHRYKRDGSHITSNVILGSRQSELWRELAHEHDVLPIHDEKTGRWKLFRG